MSDLIRDLVVNRRARHDYLLTDHFEAGVALLGSEVKSLRSGQANLQESFVAVRAAGAFLVNCHISHYTEANRENHIVRRERQLLLHSHELSKLRKATTIKGMTVVPVRFYLKGSRIKLEIAIGQGKKHHDKRASLKEQQAKREMARIKR